MKKITLSLGMLFLAATAVFAQDKKAAQTLTVQSPKDAPTAKAAPVTDAGAQDAANMKFESEIHDFGTVPQNIPADFTFEFKNAGKEPIVIQRAQPSCGCTTPSYSKDPVLPGKTGNLKASYNAAHEGPFTKTITVFTNVGTKVLTIKGTVEKAPENSVPENTSMIKTH